jgi:MtfA peptidase
VGLLSWFRRRRAARQPFLPAWREILTREVPFYPGLDEANRAVFEEKLKLFLLTKHFIPAGGMEITDEVRVVISAGAARLVMNLDGDPLGRLTEIVVYPSAYTHPEGDAVILGEAHHFGTVVLSYDAVKQGMRVDTDGHNTALHEFAHVLDRSDGSFDGTPPLPFSAYSPWARVMSAHFLKLRDRPGRKEVLRQYGATNEAEFFAVATEAFFEKPLQLKKRHPELYGVLAGYYKVDPAP